MSRFLARTTGVGEGERGRGGDRTRCPSPPPPLTPSPPLLLALIALGVVSGCRTPPQSPTHVGSPIVTVFEQFMLDDPGENWAFRTPELWRVAVEGDRRFLQMAIPPERPMLPGVRRPQEFALYAPYQFRGFSLSARVRVDRDPSVEHRDACILFGWQDETHCYYAHLSGASDEWHNALVRVDGAKRVSLVPPGQRPPPTMTDTAWHKVDVLRDVNQGTIEVYVDAYDQEARPVFRVVDRTYAWGHVGLGSFDDHASFANVKIEGEARPSARPRVGAAGG